MAGWYIQQQHPSSLVPVDGITNTKQATVLATLGLSLAKPGVWITYDKDNPASTGGTAHFLFETSLTNTVQKYLGIYDAGVADVELDHFLERLKAEGGLTEPQFVELEDRIANALIVYGRKFLDNYQVIVKSLRNDIAKYVVTGGTPVFSNGKIVGLQEFSIQGVK